MSDTEKRFARFLTVYEERGELTGRVTGTVLDYADTARFGRFSERFAPGALEVPNDVIVNLQHDRGRPVARTGAGLRLRVEPEFVSADVDPPDTVYGREARELIRARIMRGFSIEFRSLRDRWDGTVRTVERAALVGLAIVDRPAYPASKIAMRWAACRRRARPRYWF